MEKQELVNKLEHLVDKNSVNEVIYALGLLCNEKAAHIRENWQDDITAKEWDRTAKRFYKLSVTIEI